MKANKTSRFQDLNNQFPCKKCGAMLKYQPGTQHQVCEYCHHQNDIAERNEAIEENDFHRALIELANAEPAKITGQANCDSCGASFKFAASVNAGECPFCGTDIVTNPQKNHLISPKSLLPFLIDDEQAKDKFRIWLKDLWFAPNKLKKYARDETKLTGIYLPYWTYDSQTESSYVGQRGDTYYVRKRVTYVKNGQRISTIKRIPKIRWTNVRGYVSRFFDDVLIGASLSIPRQILDRLQPWDLEQLIPYDKKYISGFQSELYQVGLDEGFDQAKQVMDALIHQDIRYDIGGDHQRIHRVNTQHSQTTYKHCLLPVWSASFLYQQKTYRFVINARTGKVEGERPYSYWKIGITLCMVLTVIFSGYYFLEQAGTFEHIQY